MSDLFGKAKDLLHSDQGEQVSDKALDAAAGAANDRTGGEHADQVQKVRDAADQHVGSE